MKIKPLPLLAAGLLACLACDIGFTGLDTEVFTVNVTTVGANLDADGYVLSVTGRADEPIGVNETKAFNVFRIDVTVELRDIAANCTAADNPQTVSVRGPTTVTCLVECT